MYRLVLEFSTYRHFFNPLYTSALKIISAFLLMLTLACAWFLSIPQAHADLFGSLNRQNPVLSVDQAFLFDFSQHEEKLRLTWNIQPGYYLYQDKIKIESIDSTLDNFIFPDGISHVDEFFGDVFIYRDNLNVDIPILTTGKTPELSISFQGCADIGICYPPKTIKIPLKIVSPPHSIDGQSNTVNTPIIDTTTSTASHITSENQSNNKTALPFSIWWALLLGLGVAFTPCVLPMYPLIVGLIGGKNRQKSTLRMSALVFSYIQGMALSYTLLGVVIALAGLKFQAALQHPVLLGSIAILFLFLAGSMFGFYTLQMPSAIQTRLVMWSNNQQGGSVIGVFLMGAIAGLLCSPCTTAPLSAILLYIAKSGDMQTGGLALYLYAIGMGIPLVLFALFGNRFLPRTGIWMQYVKEAFGFIILALPIFLLERLLPTAISELLWILLITIMVAWASIIALRSSKPFARIIQMMLLVLFVIVAYPLQQTAWQILQPHLGLLSLNQSAGSSNEQHRLEFVDIPDLKTLNQYLAEAKSDADVAGKTVLIDFYADWCTACKQFDKYTFADPDVQQALKDTLLIRLDVTKNSHEDQKVLDTYQVLGLPALLLIDKKGNEVERISGFLSATDFLAIINQHVD